MQTAELFLKYEIKKKYIFDHANEYISCMFNSACVTKAETLGCVSTNTYEWRQINALQTSSVGRSMTILSRGHNQWKHIQVLALYSLESK